MSQENNRTQDLSVNQQKDDQMNNETLSLLDFSLDDIDWDEPFELEEDESNTKPISRKDHSTEFKGEYSFSFDILEILHLKFGLLHFRPGQWEIINAILIGHDCFVLMPTGGGKSLCYQLPAVLSRGVTIVVSPLIALINDQVDKLNSLGIRAAHLCSTHTKQELNDIISKLYLPEPEIDLLYLTPERIMGSKETMDALNSLYKRGRLSRLVMDEVHCLSLWGHDFRPHYKQLSGLREKFNNLQIVCFTATATKQVETDVIVNLKLRNVKRFIQSFNRPNIKYQVIEKQEEIPAHDIVSLISEKFYRKPGIIYCLSRRDCVDLSNILRSYRITAMPYHAGLEHEVREKTQKDWMQDKFHVIVATIAFGMGIDKPDVRFVIHVTIPKSLEAYYQETGRAGRDGEISHSYLFYNYEDVLRTMWLMQHSFTIKDTLDGHYENLEQMVAFANNQIDCRRYLQLLNLGEKFDRQLCMQNIETICDNCEKFNNNVMVPMDVTKQAKELAILVQDVTKRVDITLNTALKIYKGINTKGLRHKYFGYGKLMSRLDIHRILRDLTIKRVLVNDYIKTGKFPVVHIVPGPKLRSFLNSLDEKITIPVRNIRRTPAQNSSYLISIDVSLLSPVEAIGYFAYQIKNRCRESLLDLCRRLALEKNVSVTSVLAPLAVNCIAELLPRTREELLRIQYVTVAVFNNLGAQILRVTNYFRQQTRVLEAQPVTADEVSSTSNSTVCDSGSRKRTFSEAFVSCEDSNNNSVKSTKHN